jgi:hypothetical protein
MSARDIYAKLIAAGLTHEGTCGLMGNMQAESGMKSNIAQRGMTALSDEEYTAAAAEWPVKFIHDGVGYGLCQWTYWSRKQALFNFAQERGASVGNEEMQVEFCISELKNDYPGLWALLCSVTDIYTAASEVCTVYERPAVNNITVRAGYANQLANRAKREGWGNNPSVAYGDSSLYKGAESTDGTESAEVYWPPRVICEGMSGDDVAAAQALLKARGGDVVITGDFDRRFKNRVMEWQSFNGLAADGIIGAATWAALLRR